jgi:hypothetical protein
MKQVMCIGEIIYFEKIEATYYISHAKPKKSDEKPVSILFFEVEVELEAKLVNVDPKINRCAICLPLAV